MRWRLGLLATQGELTDPQALDEWQVKMWSAKRQNSNAECKGAKQIDVVYWCLLLQPLDVLRLRRRGSRRCWGMWQLCCLPRKSTLCRNHCTKAKSSEFRKKSTELLTIAPNDRMGLPWTGSTTVLSSPHLYTSALAGHKFHAAKSLFSCHFTNCSSIHFPVVLKHTTLVNRTHGTYTTCRRHRTHRNIQTICPSGPVQWAQCLQIAQHLDECLTQRGDEPWRTSNSGDLEDKTRRPSYLNIRILSMIKLHGTIEMQHCQVVQHMKAFKKFNESLAPWRREVISKDCFKTRIVYSLQFRVLPCFPVSAWWACCLQRLEILISMIGLDFDLQLPVSAC